MKSLKMRSCLISGPSSRCLQVAPPQHSHAALRQHIAPSLNDNISLNSSFSISQHRNGRSCRTNAAKKKAAAQPEAQPLGGNGSGGALFNPMDSYIPGTMVRKEDVEPNYDDPEWMENVENWSDFWTYQRWDDEVENLNDGGDRIMRPRDEVKRAAKLVQALRDTELRTDVVQWLRPVADIDPIGVWESPPVMAEKADPYPRMSGFDARAMAEKLYKKERMDEEWRRRMNLVGSLTYASSDNSNDSRVQRFKYLERDNGREWTYQEVRDLITQNGIACKPEDHKGIVENPLVPVDYVNTMGVEYIEETEEALERMGHLATPALMARFEEEFMFTEDDFREELAYSNVFEDDDEYESLGEGWEDEETGRDVGKAEPEDVDEGEGEEEE